MSKISPHIDSKGRWLVNDEFVFSVVEIVLRGAGVEELAPLDDRSTRELIRGEVERCGGRVTTSGIDYGHQSVRQQMKGMREDIIYEMIAGLRRRLGEDRVTSREVEDDVMELVEKRAYEELDVDE